MAKLQAGFGIAQLAILVTILSMMTILALSWTVPAFISDGDKYVSTTKRLNEISSAINRFRIENNRLPCPARQTTPEYTSVAVSGVQQLYNDENYTITTNGYECVSTEGAVPTAALGLPSSYMLDGWNRRIRYTVSGALCGNNGLAVKNCSPASYNSNNGDITIKATTGGSTIATDAAYVLFSAGADGCAAYLPSGSAISCTRSADETTNTNGTTTYIQKAPASGFDDIVTFRTKTQIESLIYDPSTAVISSTLCSNNSTKLATITAAVANTVRLGITATQKTNTASSATYNYSDQAMLDLMWILQEACYAIYGTTIQCPGGGTFNSVNRACQCNDLSWDGAC